MTISSSNASETIFPRGWIWLYLEHAPALGNVSCQERAGRGARGLSLSVHDPKRNLANCRKQAFLADTLAVDGLDSHAKRNRCSRLFLQ